MYLFPYFTINRDYSLKLFDLRKMETIYSISDNVLPQYCESSLSLSSDKKYIAVGSTKGQMYIINTQTGKVRILN
jgi:hypothetical protein